MPQLWKFSQKPMKVLQQWRKFEAAENNLKGKWFVLDGIEISTSDGIDDINLVYILITVTDNITCTTKM